MEVLFLTLLNRSISAGWLVLAVLLLRFALYRAPKWTRGVLWALVALRLVCPFSIESMLSLIPSAEPVPPEILYAVHPRLDTGIPALNTATAPVMESAFAPSPGDSVNPLQVYLYLGAWLWLAGAAAMLLYAIVSCLRLRRRVAASIVLQSNVWLCDGIETPFILGVFAPRVYVPSSLREPQLSHVPAHERAHLRRRDHWWKPLGFALLAIYWFHPMLWLAYALLCRDIELACDERVYRDMPLAGRADYSQTLLDCSKSRRRLAACPLAFGEGSVKERVKAALRYQKPAFWVTALALIACAAAAVCFLTNPEEKQDENRQTEEQPPSAFVPALTASAENEKSFTNLMGFDGSYWDEELVPHHFAYHYLADLNGETLQIAESFGFERDDHIVDLDGDGMTELVCNCVYGGDGVRRVYVYRRNGSLIERGRIDYDALNLTAWDDWGANSTAEWYDPASGKLTVEYASLASSTMSRTFTCEAGYDALVWEEYARIP